MKTMLVFLELAVIAQVFLEVVNFSLWKLFSKNGWSKEESGIPVPHERSRLFEQLVYRVLSERYI